MKIKNKNTIFLFFLFLTIGCFCFEKNAKADSLLDGLVVTEIMYDPSGSNTQYAKWIELYNETSKIITLSTSGSQTGSGWRVDGLKITDSSNHYVYTQENSSIEIAPGDFFIITNEIDNFSKDYPDVEVLILESAIALTKSGSEYDLKIYDGEHSLDSVNYSRSWGADNNGKSLEKISLLEDNEKENWQESYIEGGTPGMENSMDDGADEEDIDYIGQIIINEIFPYPASDEDEFVELKNIGEEPINLSGWKIADNASHKYIFPENTIIETGDIIFVKQKLYLNNDTDIVFLFDKVTDISEKEKCIDAIEYSESEKDYSYGFDGESWLWSSVSTPGEENEFDKIEIEEKFVDGNYDVRINEILPNPKGDEKIGEYIEIYNGGDMTVDLKNWVLKDLSKTKFTFSKDYAIKPEEYLAIYRNVFKFSLNNSGEESVYLLNPGGKVVSSATYKSAKEDIAYGFNGSAWNWSKYLTPGEENKFSSAPKVEVKKVKSGYVGVPVYFEVEIKKVKSKNKDKLKYRWDFDDGSRSYLQNVNHTFKKDGKYKVKLVVDDGAGGVEKSFTIKIKKYPKASVEITRLLPNPKGNDTGEEWIEVRNNSSKEINLNGWKVATGKEKLINHPINGDIKIPAGKTFQLTRKNSLFSLNNTETKIELRYPNGKEATKISYKKDKLEEGDICLNKGGDCEWILAKEEELEEGTFEEVLGDFIKNEDVFESELSKLDFSEDYLRQSAGKLSKEESDLMKKIYQVHVANNDSAESLIIDLSVGKGLVYQENDNYRFTHSFEQVHWAAELINDVKVKILLNTI